MYRKEEGIIALSAILKLLRFSAVAIASGPVNMITGRFSRTKRIFSVALAGGIFYIFCGNFYGYEELGLLSLKGLVAFIYLVILTAAALIDQDTGRICDYFPAGIFLLGIVSLWVFPENGFRARMAGTVIVAGPMLLLTLAVRDAFGGGDIKLMAAGGFLLGWRAVLVASIIGLAASGVYCMWMLAGKRLTWKGSFALGPFLATGLGTAFFWGDSLAAVLINCCP